jgi:hypothetical protein
MDSIFAWDSNHRRPSLLLDEAAKDGIELRAFGADDEEANTMFAIFAGEQRLHLQYPEPLLITFINDIIEREAFTLTAGSEGSQRVAVDEQRKEQLSELIKKLEQGLEDAPLGDV